LTVEEILVFVWIVHRITGVLLIVLLLVQLITGFLQASTANSPLVKTLAGLHSHAGLVCLLVWAATFHGLYGLRTIALDFGLRRERLLFWAATILGVLLCGVFLVLYFRLVVP
jgi:succinate dehydrogenase cytochrome b556 subunit